MDTVYSEACFTENKLHFHIIPPQDKTPVQRFISSSYPLLKCLLGWNTLTSNAKQALPNNRIFLQHLSICFFKKGNRPRATPANPRFREIPTLLVPMGEEVIQQLRDNLTKLNGAWKIQSADIFLLPNNRAKAKWIFFGQYARKQTLHRLSIVFKITLNNKEIASSRSYGGQEHFVSIA